MSQITIRSARPEDIPTLLGLINASSAGLPLQAWQMSARPGQSAWDRGRDLMLDQDSGIHFGHCWIAQTAEGGVGGLVFQAPLPAHGRMDEPDTPFLRPLRELVAEAEGSTHVSHLCTMDGWRRHGIGSALLGFAESFRARRGMSAIISSANREGRSLCRRFGYADRSRRRLVLPNGHSTDDDWILVCKP